MQEPPVAWGLADKPVSSQVAARRQSQWLPVDLGYTPAPSLSLSPLGILTRAGTEAVPHVKQNNWEEFCLSGLPK